MSKDSLRRKNTKQGFLFRRLTAMAAASLLLGATVGPMVSAAELATGPANGAGAAKPGAVERAAEKNARLGVEGTTAAARPDYPIDELMIGDKLQVSFFEQLDLGKSADAGMTADIRTFYQRLDLTGEHVVEADGSINIALLGRFEIGGMTSDEARIKVMEAYKGIMGRQGEVNIKIIERKPVFVTGIVKAPGSFRYEPGMIAAQAIALAGGYDRPAEAAARLIDVQRERERRLQAVNRLETLVAKRTRLLRQRGLMENPDARTSNEPADATGDGMTTLMESQLRLLDAEMSARSGEESFSSAKISSAKGQLSQLKKISEIVAKQIGLRSDRMRVLQKMQGSGISTLEALWNAQKEVADLQIQEGRLTAEIGSAENSIIQAEAETTMTKSGRTVEIERDLAAADEEIKQQKAIIDASETMISALEETASGVRIGEPLQLKILRRASAGTALLAADEATDLRPGDVVKVGVEPKVELAPAATSSSL
jgi:protein involved in polysaccharide export with SLBB domain